jgi:hypothetical protein
MEACQEGMRDTEGPDDLPWSCQELAGRSSETTPEVADAPGGSGISDAQDLSWDPDPDYLFYNYAEGFDPDVREQEGVLATRAFPERVSPWGRSVKSVAVVSSSPALLDTGYGPLIDDHDIVIRFNFAPSRGYEDDVGSRTDIRIMGRNWIFWEGDEVIIHRYSGNANHDLYVERDDSLLLMINNSDTNRLYSFNIEFLTYASDLFNAKVPSSGAIGVALALRLFGNVTLFGFTTSYSDHHKGMWHYYNDTENAEGPIADFYRSIGVDEYERELLISSSTDSQATKNHAYSSEWGLYDQLQRQGRLTRFEGDVG